jgi:hypothetical protein
LGRDRLFDYCVGTHHEVLAPERNREYSIADQLSALNVGFMERLRFSSLVKKLIHKPGIMKPWGF